MADLPFNLSEWLSPCNPEEPKPVIKKEEPVMKKENPAPALKTDQAEITNSAADIERVVCLIEASKTDIGSDYNVWIQIAFAFVSELGEAGRCYFHRISVFYPTYDKAVTDAQYDNCLKGSRKGCTIKSFFYLAKLANIDITTPIVIPLEYEEQNYRSNEPPDEPPDESGSGTLLEEEKSQFKTPCLSDKIYKQLPKILSDSCLLFKEGIERDIFFVSALTVLSACIPHFEGIYFNRNLSPHLYLFITGPSASGKGTMVWARYFGQAIQDDYNVQNTHLQEEFKILSDAYENLSKKDKIAASRPIDPPRLMFFIPANSSSSALTQLLSENHFRGIIFESEADTLSNTAKQDWGDSSDIYRKAFHHENTSMARRLNKEVIEITKPHLSICLSGTPKQVSKLMPEVENGLFSRFMYYAFEDTRGFLNPFVSYQPISYENFFTAKGYEVFHLFDKLNKRTGNIEFELTKEQAITFTSFFQNLLTKNHTLLSRDLDANTKRLGVISFRIAMVLSALRLMETPIGEAYPDKIICSDIDFENAMSIVETLESHAVAVYQRMPKVSLKGLRLVFYETLPKIFNRQVYIDVAKTIGLNISTADKYIKLFCSNLLAHEYNEYRKIKIG